VTFDNQGTNYGQHVGVDQYNVGRDISITLPTPEQRLHQLRAPVADFVGREQEIEQITQALVADNSAATVVGIRGMGGIGKTELALVVAHRVREQFPDAQLVVELFGASNPVTPEASLQSVIRTFEPQAKLPDDLPSLQALYAACLHGKRVLVLADDARDAAQVRPLHPPAGCALLITSRQTFALPGMQRFDLGTLDPAEAAALLRDIEPRIGEHAPALAKLCGYLPLALRVSAELLANDDMRSVARYLEQLQAERLRHLADPDGDSDDPAASVEASLALSYAALPAEAQQAFAQLGVFVGDFPLEAAEAVVQLPDTPSPIPDTLSLLRRRSLLEYDAASERYDLHDLARAFALARLPDVRPARLRHARYYQGVANHAQMELYLKGQVLEGLALFDRERRQIDAAWQWLMEQPQSDETDTLLLDFADAAAYVGELRYNVVRERIPQLESQAAAARRLGHKGHEFTALGNLGNAYFSRGDYPRAIEYHGQALAGMKELRDRRGEGIALGNLGLTYHNLGDYSKSVEYLEQCLSIAREMGDQRGEAIAIGNLGISYDNLGNYCKSVEYMERALSGTRELGDRHGEGAALTNLGISYHSLGDYRRATEYYEQALSINHEIGDIVGETAVLSNLGSAYQAISDYANAGSYHEQALSRCEEILGSNHPDTAISLNNLAELLRLQGDYAAARPLVERALAIHEQVLGADHPHTAISLNNQAELLRLQGDYAAARPLVERALAIHEQVLGADHPHTAIVLDNLAVILFAQGDYSAAQPLLERALAIREQTLGPDHPDYTLSLNNLAGLHYRQEDYEAAQQLYEQALEARERLLGPEHPNTATSLNNLGVLLYNRGDYQQAHAYMQRAFSIRESTLSVNHQLTAESRSNLDMIAAQLEPGNTERILD
jgi:tetratricopeptide (TPR) repeat protein